MSNLSNQWLELFRAGDYGEKGIYTPADIDEMIRNFSPNEVPHVIGHPKTDSPAFAWASQLKREGDVLLGLQDQVNPAFEEMVRQGSFKKRSVSLAKTAKGWMLKHVGWLGAKAPEVKGLKDAAFDGGDFTEIEFSEGTDMEDKALMDRIGAGIKAWFAENFAKETKEAVFTEADVKRIAAEAVTAAVAPLKAEIATHQQKFSEQQQQAAIGGAERAAETAIAQLRSKGRWVPAFDKMGGAVLFAELAKVATTIEFGEGDQKKKQTPLELMTSFMESLPKIVPTSEVYRGDRSTGPAKGSVQFTESRSKASDTSVQLADMARKRASDKNIDYGTALSQVAAENPQLCVSGMASAGSV